MGYRSVTARLELGKRLRAARNEVGMSTTDAAKFLEVAQSSISRIETGHMPVNARQLALFAKVYGADASVLAEWECLLRDGDGSDRWWTRAEFEGFLPKSYAEYIEVEDAASSLTSAHPQLIQGLLQTPGYYLALCDSNPFDLSSDQIDIGSEVRRMRQRRLQPDDGSDPLQCTFLLPVAVLDYVYGSLDAHLEQLIHLRESCENPCIELRFVPSDQMVFLEAYDLFEFPDGATPVIFGESLLTNSFIEKAYPFSTRRIKSMMELAKLRAFSTERSMEEIEQRIESCLKKSEL